MLISNLIAKLGRILSQHGEQEIWCKGRSDVEFVGGDLFVVHAHRTSHLTIQVEEEGWRGAFRSKPPIISRTTNASLVFGSTRLLPKGVTWIHPDALNKYEGKHTHIPVTASFVKLVRTTALGIPGAVSAAHVTAAIDPAGENPDLIDDVKAAFQILVDAGAFRG